MKRIRKYLIEFFGFSNEESKGFIIFFFLVFILFISSHIVPKYLFKKHSDFSRNLKKLDSYINELSSEETKLKLKQNPTDLSVIQDPNTMSFIDWTTLGMDKYLADRIVSYRLKGGYFKEKKDLKKIYGLSDSIYSKIEGHLHISEIKENKVNFSANFKKKPGILHAKINSPIVPRKKPELNSCDSTELLFISGIGSARASRIIKYRTKLGGFLDKKQLSEIYGLDSLVLKNLIDNTVLMEEPVLKKLNLNTITFKELLNHPYIDYNICKVILNFRKQHGKFNGLEDLRKIKIIDEDFIVKIEPYLEFR